MNELLEKYPLIMTVPDVADILGVSPNTIRRMIKEGALNALKVGKRYKITRTQFLDFLEENEAI